MKPKESESKNMSEKSLVRLFYQLFFVLNQPSNNTKAFFTLCQSKKGEMKN
jgi:hypothetical protein